MVFADSVTDWISAGSTLVGVVFAVFAYFQWSRQYTTTKKFEAAIEYLGVLTDLQCRIDGYLNTRSSADKAARENEIGDVANRYLRRWATYSELFDESTNELVVFALIQSHVLVGKIKSPTSSSRSIGASEAHMTAAIKKLQSHLRFGKSMSKWVEEATADALKGHA